MGPGVDVECDIRSGLPIVSDSLDYAVCIHALQDLPYLDAVPALRELRRALRPGGVLRLALPDLDRAIDAYRRGDSGYFYVTDDDARTISGKLIVQMTWYGSSRLMFTHEFARELLQRAGFQSITRCRFRETASPFVDIVELDNRERESLFVEAQK
jgi:predicted SAM-dependent methyltransferase